MKNFYYEEAEKLRDNPNDYIEFLKKHTYKRLRQILDITREQKKMAYLQEKDDSYQLLHEKEKVIQQVIWMKADAEDAKEEKKQERKRKKEEEKEMRKREESYIQSQDEEEDKPEIEEQTEEDSKEDNQPQQLLFDF